MLRKLSCNYEAASLSKHGIESLLFLPPCCLKTPVRRAKASILIVAHRAPAHVSPEESPRQSAAIQPGRTGKQAALPPCRQYRIAATPAAERERKRARYSAPLNTARRDGPPDTA